MATNVDAKLLKQTKFPPEFSQKVDMKKVNVEVMKKWIAGKISEILGSEDDVVVELCFNLLEGSRFPDIKVLQIQLTGFLDKDTPKFCKELWTLCLSAQSNPQGVPKELLEAKKLELIQEKIDAEKAAEEAQRRRDQERMRDKNIDNIRQRERAERGRGRGRGDRGYHDYDRRPPRHSRSPPPRRQRSPHPTDYRGPPPRDYVDTYIPGNRDAWRRDPRPRSPPVRRPARRSISRSITPPSRRELITVAVIELDSIHLQIHLAHDHPEDREGDAALRYHPAVLLQEGHTIASMAVLRHHCRRYQGLVLPRLNEIAGGSADRENLRLILVMKWVIHALMLVRDKATMTVCVGVAAAIGVSIRPARLPRKLQAEAPAYRGRGKGRGVGP
ncbi:MAG: hypothetical protein L6R42_000939 [Xanthoria sp. 1 TBL-2021]|nr:MAG: hypothetical protein L6R42_000939 [Xanthoria sp. 1 TBL-2021]